MGNSSGSLRRKSDTLCAIVLNGIRFSPYCPQTDLRTDGIHSGRFGVGGMGYGYWRSPKIMELHKHVRTFRDVSKREMSYQEVEEFVSEFLGVYVNPFIAGRFDLQSGGGSLYENIHPEGLKDFQERFFAHFSIYLGETWYWAPLNSINTAGFRGHGFVLLAKPEDKRVSALELDDYLKKPVFSNATSYLGVRARNVTRAREKANVVLGGILLCMYSGTQFSHTMGKSVSGFLNFDSGFSYTSSAAHVPFLSTPISLDAHDDVWLSTIDQLLVDEKNSKKVGRALRWLSAAWFADGAERYSSICQALDALTPSKCNSMMAKCGWARDHLAFDIDADAVELLFKKLRSDVAHGDAPSLVESEAYLKFLEKFGVEPLKAAFEITRQILVENFLPNIILRNHPLVDFPDALEKMQSMFERHGMQYTPPSGFDFSLLRLRNSHDPASKSA